MRTTVAVAVAALVLGLLVPPFAGTIAATASDSLHANHVHGDEQVTSDATVVVEEVFPLDEVFLVIHVDDGGEPGEVLGDVTVSSGQHYEVEVSIDDRALDGPTRLHARLYRDADGDGEFTRGEDPPVETVDEVVADEFLVREGERPVRVIADDSFGPRETAGTLEVPVVEVAEPGYVTVRTDDRGDPGRVVGVAAVEAGRNEDVAVDLADALFADGGGRDVLWLVVHADDGDGEFDPGEDPPVTVGDRPVASEVPVDLNASAVDVDANRTETTETTADTSTDPTDAGDSTAGTTADPETTDGDAPATADGDDATATTASGGDAGTTGNGDGSLPADGFGLPIAVLAVVALVVLARRRT